MDVEKAVALLEDQMNFNRTMQRGWGNSMIETDAGSLVNSELYANQHKDVADALELAIAALRAGGKDTSVNSTTAGQPLTLEQLRGMDGECVKIVVDGQEPLEMLVLVEAPEDEDCVLLRNNLGGVSEFYSDEDLMEDGVKVYAYSPANINREAWMAEWVEDGECNHKPCRVRDREKWKKYKCSKCGYKAGRRTGQKFCPSCGRAMTPEAWAELEKRGGGEKVRNKRSFEWDVWDFDCDGNAYIISKGICPNKEDVPQFIVDADGIHPDCKAEMDVREGWCKYMVRSDWENADGPCGGYYVEERSTRPINKFGKPEPGWFPVWIVRQEDWY